MQKLLKNKLVMYAFCAIAAIGLVFAAYMTIKISSANSTIEVVRVKDTVGINTQITDDMLTTVSVGSQGMGSGVITDKAALVGKYTKVSIAKQDNIYPDKLSDKPTAGSGAVTVKSDQKIVTISVSSAAAGGGGFLKSGDVVDVEAYDTTGKTTDSGISDITVYSVKNAKLADVETVSSDGDHIPVFISLVVSQDQADQLVQMEYSGKIHLVLDQK
jgi:pilus assembly protein CpaB